MKKKIIYRIITVIASLAIFIVVGFIAIMVPANSKWFYRWQFEKHDTLEWVQSQADVLDNPYSPDYDPYAAEYVENMTDAQLEDLMMHVMRYCMWLEDDLNITVNGRHLKIFRSDEVSHMQDVKNVFGGGIIITIVALLVCIAFLFILINKSENYYKTSRNVPFITLASVVGLIGVVAIFAVSDFALAFEIFHQIFFTGNYTFANGVMISMISEIFTDLAAIIGVGWVVLLALPTVALILYNRHCKKVAKATEAAPENITSE